MSYMDDVKRMFTEGLTLEEIAGKVRRSARTIVDRLRREGYSQRGDIWVNRETGECLNNPQPLEAAKPTEQEVGEPIVTVDIRTLKNANGVALSTDINVITAEINAYQRVAGEAIFEIGRRLKGVRDNPEEYGFEGYRDWERWCSDELGMTRQHANRFIKVFDRFSEYETGTPVFRLPTSMSVLYELIPYDDEELEMPREMPDGTMKKLTEMSRREIEEFKRREREAVAEKEKALRAADEAEKRAKQAEESAEESARVNHELMDTLREIESRPTPEPKVEPVEVPVHDPATTERLRRYEEKFGDIEIYEQGAVRIGNIADVSAATQTFEYEIRNMLKKYAFLTQYQRELSTLPQVVSQEFEGTIIAWGGFLQELSDCFYSSRKGAKIINI